MSGSDSPKVLVVDDDPGILGLLAEALSLEGYRVTTAPDGTSGLAAALTATPDLVLTDLAMPGMGGEDLCRRLRADPRTSAVPLIIITALPPAEARVRLDDSPHDDLLAKPFELDELIAIVDRHLMPRA